ncbi:MAG: methenyltetrahydromethanopterin cyclohydrolase [Betaproteobacteria bacterium TMED82]|nr:MAG: methenyltetrahydromethanopterin cyclohydrolase [Betaproteobacteria bacterium TMED82]
MKIPEYSLNDESFRLFKEILLKKNSLKVQALEGPLGSMILDAGISVSGGSLVGVLIAEICMGGLGNVRLDVNSTSRLQNWVTVRSEFPVLACLASQYAGWSLSGRKNINEDKVFNCLGSGPARALACREELFSDLNYKDISQYGVMVMEVSTIPPIDVIEKISNNCNIETNKLALILTPTTSLAGTTQVVSRVLEVGLHKAHTLGFPLDNIRSGSGRAPLPTPGKNLVEAMGRTNDAILYGGSVHILVDCSDTDAEQLAYEIPSSNSEDYGESFSNIFKNVDYDFYKIDPALFAPAEILISNLSSGKTWKKGNLNLELLEKLWIQH